MNGKPALDYLLNLEYSMGNGQCPDCCGSNPKLDWWTKTWGHKKDCKLADALRCLGYEAVAEFEPTDSDRGKDSLTLRKEFSDWVLKKQDQLIFESISAGNKIE